MGSYRCLLKGKSCWEAGIAPNHPLANPVSLKQRTRGSSAFPFNAFGSWLFQLPPRLMTSCLLSLWARCTSRRGACTLHKEKQ